MSHSVRLSFALLCLGTPACGSQATPDYAGESLLSLVGSVTIENDQTEGKLVPALAFENDDEGRLDIMDVEVHGEFPSNFSLAVHRPPGKESLMEGPPGEPRFALGFITAVTAAHAPFIPFASGSAETGSCDADACYRETEYCAGEDNCYRESQRCDTQVMNCVVTSSSGDPTLKEDPWRSFAGLSANYQVLYLPAPAPAGGELSREFGGGARLAAGYHLVSVHMPTPQEQQAAEECYERARADIVRAYNDAHGTSYADFDELTSPCSIDVGGGPQTPCHALDGDGMEALWDQLDQRELQLGCDIPDFAPVPDPQHTRISVRIARDVGPFQSSDSGPSQAPAAGDG